MRKFLTSEGKKLKAMSAGQRLGYILEYYWLWILGIGSALFLTSYLIWNYTTAIRDNWISVAFPGALEQAGEGSALWKDYVAFTGYDVKRKNVRFRDGLYFDATREAGTNNSYYQAFVSMIEAGELDAAVMETAQLTAVGESGRFLDLRSGEAGNLLEKYGDRLVYALPYDTEYSAVPVPVGIDISDSLLVTKYHLYEGDCALGIGAYSRRVEAAERFLAWILEE